MPKQPIDALSIVETNALLNEISEPRDKAIITLLISTGLFLNELIDLAPSDIDWENHKLTIPGHRGREIALNDQVHTALAKYSQTRPDTPCKQFFITNKGPVNKLATRNINKLIHKYATSAKIKTPVNVHTLRNTFAVSLFSKGMDKDDVAKLLGITDTKTIQRYAQAAKQPDELISPEELQTLEAIDTRSFGQKLVAKVLPTEPKEPVTGELSTVDPETLILGRDSEIHDLKLSLAKGQSMLITGPLGIGKTHLLKHLAHELKPQALFVSTPSPLKTIITQLCDLFAPDWEKDLGKRALSNDMLTHLVQHQAKDAFVLVIDNLDKLKTSDVEQFLVLLENFTILGAVETPKPALKAVWWKFQTLELGPLDTDASKELIKQLTSAMTITNYQQMETKILTVACGVPLAIVDMIKQLSHHHRVNTASVDDLYHEAGVTYRDWSALIVIAWGLLAMFRFISLGTHQFEGYIFAGIGMSALMTVRYFVLRRR